jgi:hypothetical protein
MEATQLKLYVKPAVNSMKVVRFIRDNKAVIARLGAKVRVVMLKEGDSARNYADLRTAKVKELPALQTPKQMLIGANNIIGYFTQKIREGSGQRQGQHPPMPTTAEAFILAEAFSDRNEKDGDERMGEGQDYSRAMSDMTARRGGDNRRPPGQRAPAEQPARQRANPEPRDEEPLPVDNVRQAAPRRPAAPGALDEDTLEQMMADALSGNPQQMVF